MINLAYMLQDSPPPSPTHTLHIQPIHFFFGTSDKERKDADNAYAGRLKKQLKD